MQDNVFLLKKMWAYCTSNSPIRILRVVLYMFDTLYADAIATEHIMRMQLLAESAALK